ncbi:hypothetical protein A7W90_15760 [Clostridium sp. Bc-iso-3]|nr:hypothetical protein A7W90_15760 [Clostridium sp. Bc-iso-3]
MLGKEIVIEIGGEVIGSRGTTAQRFSVPHLLDVAQAAGDAAVPVRVEGVEVDGHTGVAAGIDFGAVQDGLHGAVHNLGCGGAVGVDEVGALVGFIVPLQITVPQGELQRGLVGDLAAELGGSVLDSGVHGGVDGIDGLGVGLGDDEGNAVLGVASVDGSRLPDVGVGQADNTGDHLGRVLVIDRHIVIPP